MTSDDQLQKRRRLRRALIGLAMVVAVVALFAWRQGDDADAPLNAIAEAAERTQREAGGRATLRAVISPAHSEPFMMTGEMVFNTKTERSQMAMRVPRPDSDDVVEMEFVADGTSLYMRSSAFGALPGGREWMGLDLALGEALETPAPANGDAKANFELLEAVGSDVKELGKEDVRGVPTTRYRGTVGVPEQAELLRKQGGEGLAVVAEEKGTPTHIEAWVDAEGLVRRMRVVKAMPPQGDEGPANTDMRIEFVEFGIVPEIAVPDPDDVFDATSLTRKRLGVSGDR